MSYHFALDVLDLVYVYFTCGPHNSIPYLNFPFIIPFASCCVNLVLIDLDTILTAESLDLNCMTNAFLQWIKWWSHFLSELKVNPKILMCSICLSVNTFPFLSVVVNLI